MSLRIRALLTLACLALAPSCSDSDAEDAAANEDSEPTDDDDTPSAESDDDDGPTPSAESDDDDGPGTEPEPDSEAAGPGLCVAVDIPAVVALMEEPLEITDDTNLRCELSGEGPNSFVVERNLTGGADRYDQQLGLLGSDEILEDIGDRAFRSGFVYGIQVGEQYVTVVFAIARQIDAAERLAIVEHVVASLP